MCDPVSVAIGLSAVGTGVKVAGDVAGAKAQKQQASAVRQAAGDALTNDLSTLNEQASQQKDAATTTIFQQDRQARMADATARVSAGEAGVKGASVDALLTDINRQKGEANTAVDVNLQNILDQIDRQRRGAVATYKNRVAGAPFPSDLATGLKIGGDVLGGATSIIGALPRPTSGG